MTDMNFIWVYGFSLGLFFAALGMSCFGYFAYRGLKACEKDFKDAARQEESRAYTERLGLR